MKKVFLIGACRTPIGRMGGVLSSLSAVDLGSVVIKATMKRANVPTDKVEHVYMGCVLQGGLGQNVARQAALKAGLSSETTAQTINVVCGSGLDAINSAARMVQVGEANVVIAGGMESMSNAPFAIMNARYGYKMGSPMIDTPMIDTMVKDALWDAVNDYHMGITAENVCEKWDISRQELDEFAFQSQKKTSVAVSSGLFKDEIVPVNVKSRRESIIVDCDEAPRPDTTIEGLAKLRPAFKQDGVVTAGNSSGINDGAAAVMLVSEDVVKEMNLKPDAEWFGGALGGVDPAIMGVGPVCSTKKLLKKLNMTLEEIDFIEANEAFASQSIAVKRELEIPDEKLNVNGGAIALGHPVGASGCRILVTLINVLKQKQKAMGLATLCIGGGMGCSTIIRRCR